MTILKPRCSSSVCHTAARATALLLTAFSSGVAQTSEDLHKLFVSGNIFALRDAINQKDVPPFYRGAVASSLNHIVDAVSYLHEVIKTDPASEDAYQAHDLLANMYQRNGLYREALFELNAAIQERSRSKELQNAKPLFEALATSGDMTVVSLHRTKIHGIHDRQIPMRVNGKLDNLAFDTGAGISFISDREAAHLGLTAQPVRTKLNDSSGNGIAGFRVAIAKDLEIGGLHLRNVPFLVIPDTNEPFVEFGPKEGHRGLIGLPVLLAMRSIRWTTNGDFEFDFPPTTATGTSNLLFHETNPVVQVVDGDRKLDFTLDTGAVGTDLNPLFAESFPDLISSGKRETNTITGIGGSKDYESVLLPSVSLTVGGKAVTIAPAHVSVAQGLGGVSIWAGNLGNDLLNQGDAVTVDFRVMSLTLE
jgi:hypothetical protein